MSSPRSSAPTWAKTKLLMDKDFLSLWNAHKKWGKGIIFSDIVNDEQSEIFLFNDDPSSFYNFAVPTVDFNKFDFVKLENAFQKREKTPAIYLDQKIQREGFLEKAVRRSYKLYTRDTWLMVDKTVYKSSNFGVDILTVNEDNFEDYRSVLSIVFSDYPGNATYLDMCFRTLKEKTDNYFNDFTSEFYLIYEEDKPVAGAGMFYSKDGDFAYLHNTGTLESYRGKGYQSALIKYRADKALSLGINYIYSIVEHGSQSWRNLIKMDFKEGQTVLLLNKAS